MHYRTLVVVYVAGGGHVALFVVGGVTEITVAYRL